MSNGILRYAINHIINRITYAHPNAISDGDLLIEIRAYAQTVLHSAPPVPTQYSKPITTVEYDRKSRTHAVRCNGEIIEYFPTHDLAVQFANTYDEVTPNEVEHGENKAVNG